MQKLPRSFYGRDTIAVARELLGKWLVHAARGEERVGKIVEAEAYLGPHDLAAHSAKGLTERTKVMFGPPGHAYVYLIYGMYNCMNVVTEREGHASAVDRRGGIGHALGHRQEVLAPPGQAMAVRPALEQARAEVPLELTQVSDERRLAQAERARGPPQAARLSHREKDTQVVPLHGASLAIPGEKDALRIWSRVIRT